MPDRRTGLYPGTFDPPTNGHLDIIARAARLVDRLLVCVAENTGKQPLFALENRLSLLRHDVETLAVPAGVAIDIIPFNGLLVDLATRHDARMIVRGLRAVSDFDYEFQMAGMNYRLNHTVETVFLMSSEHHQFISSRFVKEIARLGGDITSFVSPFVKQHLLARLPQVANMPDPAAGLAS